MRGFFSPNQKKAAGQAPDWPSNTPLPNRCGKDRPTQIRGGGLFSPEVPKYIRRTKTLPKFTNLEKTRTRFLRSHRIAL
jgi:hypothetical protein